jgi:hypothetical protein
MEPDAKKWKFDHENVKEKINLDTLENNPEKSRGFLDIIGKVMINKIGQRLLFHHDWVNFIKSCALAYTACVKNPLEEARSRWSIFYNDKMVGRVGWRFKHTQGMFHLKSNALHYTVKHAECLHFKRTDHVQLFLQDEEPISLMQNIESSLLVRRIERIDTMTVADWVYFERDKPKLYHHDNIAVPKNPWLKQHQYLIFGQYGLFHPDEYEQDIAIHGSKYDNLDNIFLSPQVNMEEMILVPSQELMNEIEYEICYFIHHLNKILHVSHQNQLWYLV